MRDQCISQRLLPITPRIERHARQLRFSNSSKFAATPVFVTIDVARRQGHRYEIPFSLRATCLLETRSVCTLSVGLVDASAGSPFIAWSTSAWASG